MGKIVKKRKLFVSKKSFYRQIAQKRKDKWAQKYQLQHQEQFKFHFCKNQDSDHNDHYNGNAKGDFKSQQKIKNRVAAQESRQKRKYYLQEMEKKLQLYEQLLETQTCRLCHSNLKEKSQSDLGMNEEKGSTLEQVKQNYFQEGLIRVDNEGASTPFAIFFFICFIVLLTIFTYSGQSTQQRILSHNEPIIHSAVLPKKQDGGEIAKQGYTKQPTNYIDLTAKVVAQHLQAPKHLKQSLLSNEKNWKLYKDLLCTKSQLVENNNKTQNKKAFLALRAKNHLKEEAPSEIQKANDSSSQSQWKRDILNCIVYEPITV